MPPYVAATNVSSTLVSQNTGALRVLLPSRNLEIALGLGLAAEEGLTAAEAYPDTEDTDYAFAIRSGPELAWLTSDCFGATLRSFGEPPRMAELGFNPKAMTE